MPRSLTSLFHASDREWVAKTQATVEGRLLVFDADAHAALLRDDVPHETPWDHVTPGDRAALETHEAALRRAWFIHARLPYRGVDLLALARYRHLRWLVRFAWVDFVLRRAIEHERPACLRVPRTIAGHGLDRGPEDRVMPLLHGVAAAAAESLGVAIEWGHAVPAPASPSPVASSQAVGEPPRGAHVLLLGNGPELLRQLPLVQAWAAVADLPIARVYKAADPATLQRLRDAGHAPIHESAYLGTIEDDAEFQAAADAARDRFRRDAAQSILASPHVASHIDFLFGSYAEAMARQVSGWRRRFEVAPPALVVSCYPTPAIDVAAAMEIPTLVLPHGPMMLGEIDYHRSLPPTTHVGAVGERHRAILVRHGIEPTRIHVTGDPGADWRREPAPPRGRDGRPRVLVPTSFTTCPALAGSLPEIDWTRERRVLLALCFAARERGWRLILRPHPRYDHDPSYYETLIIAAGASDHVGIDNVGSLADAVRDSDVVVFPCGQSSALLEASGRGRPVFLLTEATIWLDRARWGVDAWPACAGVDELVEEIGRCCSDPDHHAMRADETTRALGDVLGAEGRDSVNRTVATMRALSSRS